MKNILILNFLSFVSISVFGQLGDYYDLNFDGSFSIEHLAIDTSSNPNNIWQVGMVQKSIFSSAFSPPNVIVTDTINAYPTNDTSSFILTNVVYGPGFMLPFVVIVSGQYYVNSDTLTDYGTIEMSPDNGNTWIDLINDTVYTDAIWWGTTKPTLTGNSNGWLNFNANIAGLGPIFNIQSGDTILYRFTFISDSVQTFKDGLMFDDFHFEDYAEGIEEIQNDNLISVYPNPVNDQLSIKINQINSSQTIQITNYQGQVVYDNKYFQDSYIDTKHLNNGLYFLSYSDTKSFSVKKFVVNH